MKALKILIVEDEILIADNIKRYLNRKGHDVVGIAISYKEAIDLYLEKSPDIAILDIKLSGPKTGIDVAKFIQKQNKKIPFIFLTSQMDVNNINEAKDTFPAGYLSKPIQKDSLYATIEIAMHKQILINKNLDIALSDGIKKYKVPINEILFLQADHVYVKVYIANNKHIVLRSAFKDLLERLPKEQFIQTHRSFIINIDHINRWDNESIYIQENIIPISRSRKKELQLKLKIG